MGHTVLLFSLLSHIYDFLYYVTYKIKIPFQKERQAHESWLCCTMYLYLMLLQGFQCLGKNYFFFKEFEGCSSMWSSV